MVLFKKGLQCITATLQNGDMHVIYCDIPRNHPKPIYNQTKSPICEICVHDNV